jgi:hypothetical protein
MKSKTEARNTTKKNTAKKKTAPKTATPPKALPAGLHKKQGVWVFSTGKPITAAQMERLRQSIYRERENRCMGNLAKPNAKTSLRRHRLLQFLQDKEPAWKNKDHPELAAGASNRVRKLRSESEVSRGRKTDGQRPRLAR